jgi:hypothetical protein
MRMTASGTSSAQTTMPIPHHKCGQGRFLQGSALALYLLPALDFNQQSCDSESNLLIRTGCYSALPVNCGVVGQKRSSVLASCRHIAPQYGDKVGCRS